MRYSARASLLFILVWMYQVLTSAQVVIPAVVTDAAGQPVSGLQKHDFTLEPKDHVQLEDVEEVPPLAGTSVPVFILYDAASVTGLDQEKIHTEVLQVLSRAAREHDSITVILRSTKGLELIHDMTTDPAVFSAAINRALPDHAKDGALQGQHSGGTDARFESEVSAEVARLQELIKARPDTRSKPWFDASLDELAGIQKMAELMQGSKKRKILVWVGICCSTLMFDNGRIVDGADYGPGRRSPYFQDPHSRDEKVHSIPVAYEKMVEAVNASRFSVYVYSPPLIAGGLQFLPQGGLLEDLAQRTAGRYVGRSATLDSAVSEARKDLAPYYLLRVRADSPKAPTPVKLKLSVDKAEVHIRSCNGFLNVAH
ncbi:MAG TPA: hypothetical protein VMU05_25890 [Dongiaceae bacterium]|nr:hypothetical protein [Dongiaceae bacterium]